MSNRSRSRCGRAAGPVRRSDPPKPPPAPEAPSSTEDAARALFAAQANLVGQHLGAAIGPLTQAGILPNAILSALVGAVLVYAQLGDRETVKAMLKVALAQLDKDAG